MAKKKALIGFSNLGVIDDVTDEFDEYSAAGEKTSLVGAYSCSPTDNKPEYTIPADDGNYDEGAEWEDTDIDIDVREMELKNLAKMSGAEFDTTEDLQEEGTFDDPVPLALTFASLRRDQGYRLFRYYVCKLMSYSVSHQTKGESADVQNYTLHIKCLPRKVDNKIRGTKDIAKGAALTWLNTIPGVTKTPPTP